MAGAAAPNETARTAEVLLLTTRLIADPLLASTLTSNIATVRVIGVFIVSQNFRVDQINGTG